LTLLFSRRPFCSATTERYMVVIGCESSTMRPLESAMRMTLPWSM
jgi:hypothetical protein